VPVVFVAGVLASGCVSSARYEAKVAELEAKDRALENARAEQAKDDQTARELEARLKRAQEAWLKEATRGERLSAELNAGSERRRELERSLNEREDLVAWLESELGTQQALLAEFKALAIAYGADSPAELEAALRSIQSRVNATEQALRLANEELARQRRISQKLQRLIDAGKLRVRSRAGRLSLELPGDIHFASGRASLTEDGKSTLAEVAVVLQAESDRLFVVEGHTDNVPVAVSGFRSNWHLGATRAETSREALVGAGLDAHRVAIATWADLLPACPEVDEPQCRQRNRRVEILLLPRFE
jgi:chemotaxis protein MotB